MGSMSEVTQFDPKDRVCPRDVRNRPQSRTPRWWLSELKATSKTLSS